MTRSELMSRMSSEEFVGWFAYFDLVNRKTATAEDEAEPASDSDWGASLKGRMLAWQAKREGSER